MSSIRGALRLLAIVFLGNISVSQAQDPLPSWNDGPAKQAIVDFVQATTERAARNSFRPRSASPPSTKTARCG